MNANSIIIKGNKTEIDTNIIVIISKSRVRVRIDHQNSDNYASIKAIIPGRLYFLLVPLHFPSYSRLYILLSLTFCTLDNATYRCLWANGGDLRSSKHACSSWPADSILSNNYLVTHATNITLWFVNWKTVLIFMGTAFLVIETTFQMVTEIWILFLILRITFSLLQNSVLSYTLALYLLLILLYY